MEELGVGGFMGVQDVKPGMKIAVAFKNKVGNKTTEYSGEVVGCKGKDIHVSVNDKGYNIAESITDNSALCQLRIVVDNVLYCWDDIPIYESKENENGNYYLAVESNPKVFNRRKYPRMPISNSCNVYVAETNKKYRAKMVNISANGFAFAVRDDIFANMKGKNVFVSLLSFEVLEGRDLEGCVIRSSNNDGEYIVGCRMPEDNTAIKEYVSKNYCE